MLRCALTLLLAGSSAFEYAGQAVSAFDQGGQAVLAFPAHVSELLLIL